MDPSGATAALSHLLGAFGLSSAAGLNAYIPLLAVGLLARAGYLSLPQPYSLLATVPVLVVLAVFAVVDFVADKIPAVDHAAHIVGAFLNPVAGAIVFASQTRLMGNIHPAVALAAGFLVAGGFHAARAAARPVATTATAGIANPVLSFAEDATSLTVSLLAVFAPILAILLLVLLVAGGVWAWRRLRDRLAAAAALLRGPREADAPERR